jgi:hypothetical protein
MKRIIISEEEKSRILGMHVEATKRHYGLVSEQSRQPKENPTDIYGIPYYLPGITPELLAKLKTITDGHEGENLQYVYNISNPKFVSSEALPKYISSTKNIDGGHYRASQLHNLPTPARALWYILTTIRNGIDDVARVGMPVTENQLSPQTKEYFGVLNNMFSGTGNRYWLKLINDVAAKRVQEEGLQFRTT